MSLWAALALGALVSVRARSRTTEGQAAVIAMAVLVAGLCLLAVLDPLTGAAACHGWELSHGPGKIHMVCAARLLRAFYARFTQTAGGPPPVTSVAGAALQVRGP